MSNQEYDIEIIARSAASLSERISLTEPEYGRDSNAAFVASILSQWAAQAAQGHSAKFERRLAWQGLDQERVARLLGQPDAGRFRSEPEWVPTLRAILSFLNGSSPAQWALPNVGKTVPFVHALTPLVEFGMEALASRMAEPLASNLAHSVRGNLVELLAGVCALTLGEEFERFRRHRGWLPGSGRGSTVLYDAFVMGAGSGYWQRIFVQYPVLARLVATRIGHWVDDTVVFLDRLKRETPGIAVAFFAGNALAPVLSVSSSLSDPHDRGRTVRIVTFEDGRKIVYKPRNLAIDEAWQKLTLWLAGKEDFFRIRAPVVWNRESHGWVEFIEHAPCDGIEGVRTFYRHAGMLTCLLYAIRGSDFHRENLIASGEDPTPVDLETLFVPLMKSSGLGDDNGANQFLGTVLQTLLLPAWTPGSDGRTPYDNSGLGSYLDDQCPGEVDGWSGVNTDAMLFERRPRKLIQSRNLPSSGNNSLDPTDFVEEVTSGFDAAYRALMHHRTALLAPDGPIENFRGCPGRFVVRSTRIYGRILQRSLAPRFLRNGIERSLQLEGLSRRFLAPSERYDGGRIFLAELEALEQLDMPRFTVYPELDSLGLSNGERLEAVLDAPGYPSVVERLRGLDEDDLDYQLELIRCSFAVRNLRLESRGGRQSVSAPPLRPSGAGLSLESNEFLARASAIADCIARRTIWDGDTARWLGIDFNSNISRFTVGQLSPSFYSGLAGIALFFAAMYSLGGGDPAHRRIAIGATRSVCQDFWGPGMDGDITATTARSCGLGMGSGLAGITYALLTCARLLAEPGLVEDAVRLGLLIDEGLISSDDKLDVMAGAAGAIIGLLPLWEHSGRQVFLDRAALCAEHLLSHQIVENGNRGGWITLAPRPLAGLSHGAAGIALALIRASRATGMSKFLEAARRAMAYERSIFLPGANNWLDLREHGKPPSVGSWCHGAPGIGLARLDCLPYDEGGRIQEEIETAAKWLHNNSLSPADHLCCGEMGKVDVLLETGQRLSRVDWVNAGRQRACAVIARSDAEEGVFYSNTGPANSMFSPGFFNGLSGIGYEFLRLYDASGRLPCALLFDT